MEFITLPCHESLRPFIYNYWVMNADCTSRGTQTMFSNGAANLQFYLSQPIAPEDSDQRHSTILFHLEMKSINLVTEPGPVNIFGVEFVFFCSRLFFKNKFQGDYQTPEQLGDAEFMEVCNRVHEAGDMDERVRLLDEFFLKRLAELPAKDVNLIRLQHVFDEIVPVDGSVAPPPIDRDDFSPSDLASTACLSQKQFTRVFNKYMGMNPKTYLRLLRFHKALRELQQADEETSLTDVAYRCGYYDLPHMTADFNEICGFTPSQLKANQSGLTETFGSEFNILMRKKIKVENLR